jgi:uncharacterized repeat protein (TIGR03803 family)
MYSTTRGQTVRTMLAVTLFGISAVMAQAQSITVLHYFANGPDGEGPQTGVAIDPGGNVYGTTTFGGDRSPTCAPNGGCGVVYRASLKNGSWIFTPLYDFHGGDDGSNPYASVTVGPDGALYGTTLNGGGGQGTVFKLTPPARFCHQVLCTWTETVLHRFTNDGLGSPFGGVIFDAAGNLYGFTSGAIYQLSRFGGTWTLNVLYRLRSDIDGAFVMGAPTMDAAGNIYGVALFGGSNNDGTVFRLVRSGGGWNFELLYTFTGGSDGGNPWGVAIVDGNGNVFGDTSAFNGGVFELSPNGDSWSFSLIVPIRGGLQSAINFGPDGNIYGTNYSDGSHGLGSVFQVTHTQSGWVHNIIHSFDGPDDGALPLSNVVFDASGNMYGTTTMGGRNGGYGTVWQLTP